jgi:hypothetical protein
MGQLQQELQSILNGPNGGLDDAANSGAIDEAIEEERRLKQAFDSFLRSSLLGQLPAHTFTFFDYGEVSSSSSASASSLSPTMVVFRVKQYLDGHKAQARPFVSALVRTTAFAEFCSRTNRNKN